MDGEKIVSSDFGRAADTWRRGCHALGARVRQARLTVDPGERFCSPRTCGCCLLYQKMMVLAWQRDQTLLAAKPKTFPKGVTALGVAGQPNPKHFKKVLGLVAQPDPSILGLAAQQYPRILGRAPQPDPRILGVGCFALFSDLNLFFIQ